MGHWGHRPHRPACLAPKAALTLPAQQARWAIGVTGSWGACSLHSEASSAPPAGPAVNGPLVAVTGRGVGVGARVAPWLCCFGEGCTSGPSHLGSPCCEPERWAGGGRSVPTSHGCQCSRTSTLALVRVFLFLPWGGGGEAAGGPGCEMKPQLPALPHECILWATSPCLPLYLSKVGAGQFLLELEGEAPLQDLFLL